MKRIRPLFLALVLVLTMTSFAPPAQAAGTKLIAITYDDGPSVYTASLLDGLKERGVKATFFMVGTNVARYPDTVARVYREGHQVANHSYDHPQLSTLSASGIQSQIQRVNSMLDKACGAGTSYMLRPPYGSINATVRQASGSPLILWSVDPLDWKYRNAETVKNNIINQAHDGAIILVHDIHATSIPGSLAAIDYLQAQGYEFVTVRELMRRRGYTPENGVSYGKLVSKGIEDPGPVAAPVITAQAEGDQLRITITAQGGASIYYTLGNGPLNQESTRYTSSFLASPPCTVTAVAAFNMNGSRSDTVVETLQPVAAPPELQFADGLLTVTSSDPAAQLSYSLNGGAFQPYTAPVSLQPQTEIAARAQRTGYLDSAAVQASYSPNGNFFLDVPSGQWYYEAMDWAISAGYMNGVSEGRYAPTGSLQRGQLLALLYRFSGQTVESGAVAALPFTDVPQDAYYAQAVAWAHQAGILGGAASGDTFEPLRAATRQELCVILYNYLRTQNVPLPTPSGRAAQYADSGAIAPWAYEAVGQMTTLGLMSGDDTGNFSPTAETDRAQAAAMLLRLSEFLDSGE